jgi:hypothetical protein
MRPRLSRLFLAAFLAGGARLSQPQHVRLRKRSRRFEASRANLRAAAGTAALRNLALALFLLAFPLARCGAQTGTQHEYELKAGILYRIIEYVEWPAGSLPENQPVLQIGLLGQIPHPEALEVLDGKKIQGRKLIVKRLAGLSAAAECQVLFIGASEKPRLPEIVADIKDRPVLTVSEVEGFADNGGMVNLVPAQNRIVMEINREVAGRARLSISSQLLKLARVLPR